MAKKSSAQTALNPPDPDTVVDGLMPGEQRQPGEKSGKQLRARYRREKKLEAYQVELLKLQAHLESTGKKMIVIFEGRDAAGKGGTIRRVTRYMNEKHYRVVALGRPTDEQRGQWFLQKYVTQFPRAGEMVLFDRSWYNRAMVEPVFGFCNGVPKFRAMARCDLGT